MAEGLDAQEMLQTLRQQRTSRVKRDRPEPQSVRTADFSGLDGYAQMRLMKAASEEFDLPSPFFREIEDMRGAEVLIDDAWRVNFASYDYLGLNQRPELRQAAQAAVKKWGVSAGASRLVGGEKLPHGHLEQKIADFYGVEAAIVMVSGHGTNVGTVRALMGKGDLVLMDALIHNSVAEGVRHSGAAHLTYPHNDWEWIDRTLSELRGDYRHVLIVTEGLFSMDGDCPDLSRFVEVKSRHSAWLMVDEAHSIGVLGPRGRGISEAQNIPANAVDIWMGTLSKTLASCGGYIAGTTELIDYLRFKCPGFVYSVGLSLPNTAAAAAAFEILETGGAPVAKLQANGALFHHLAQAAGLNIGLSAGHAIAPVVIGDSMKTVIASKRLLERGHNVLPILFPAVPEKQARLRFFMTAGHEETDIRAVVSDTAAVISEIADWSFTRR